MENKKELREIILEGTLSVFCEKGMKFTMDDIAIHLGMSKKTIYKAFRDKESMFLATVDYLFDSIKESEQEVVMDENLGTVEKIRNILGAFPERYKNVDFQKLSQLREKYPNVYQRVEKRLETGWEKTFALMEQGIEEGVIRPINIPLFKMMMEVTLEQFFQRDILIQNHILYADALNEVVTILVDGIQNKSLIK